MFDRVQILNARVDNLSIDEAAVAISRLSQTKLFSYTITANVDHLIKLQEDNEFRRIYESADLVVADGVPLLWAAHFLGRPLQGRVNGTDLFELLVADAAETKRSVFLLGGEEGAARASAARFKQRHPGLDISWHCPPLGFENDAAENEKIKAAIRNAGACYLFVGLGAPKQEKWITRHAAEAGVRHAVGVGVSFSFVAGKILRAPGWMQRSGLEWLWRLLAEPRRLWKRYLVDDPRFFWLVAKQRCRGGVYRHEEPI